MTNNLTRGADVDESTHKACTKCLTIKPLTEFHRDRDNRDGRRGACKRCSIAIATAYKRKRRAQMVDRVVTPPDRKTCRRCKLERPGAEFYPDALERDGVKTWCKSCSKDAARDSAERRKLREKTPPADGLKVCTRCDGQFQVSLFYPSQVTRDGFTASCAECLRRVRRDWSAGNADKVREYRAAYDLIHRDRKLERLREWRESNVEHRREYARRYGTENAEQVAKFKRAWYEANKDEIARRNREDPARMARRREVGRRQRERHRDVLAERQRRRRVDKLGLTIELVDLDALWTGVCGICDRPMDASLVWPDPFSKSIDHIMPLSLGGTHERHNLQWAHLRCNISKGARVP